MVSGEVTSMMGVTSVKKVTMSRIRQEVATQRPTHRAALLTCTTAETPADHSVKKCVPAI
jgi:hypothetical protein